MPATDFGRQPAALSVAIDRPASYASGFDEPHPTIRVNKSEMLSRDDAPLRFTLMLVLPFNIRLVVVVTFILRDRVADLVKFHINT